MLWTPFRCTFLSGTVFETVSPLSSQSAILRPESEEDSDTASKAEPNPSALPLCKMQSSFIAFYFSHVLHPQETLAPLYQSGSGGGIGGLGGSKGAPCETTHLIYPATQSATMDETLCTFPTAAPDVRVSIPATETPEEEEVPREPAVTESQSEGSGEPEEVSEDEEVGEVAVVAPLLASSCACIMPVRQPLEVGENEDCSQAVTPGSSGSCSCGGLDGDEGGGREKSESLKVERGLSLVSHSPQVPELCLPLSQAQARPQLKPRPSAAEDPCSLASTDSSSPKEDSEASDSTSVTRPLAVSPSVSGLQLDKTPEAANHGPNGLSWGDSRAGQLSSVETALECTPESLHSQLAEPTLTSGWYQREKLSKSWLVRSVKG